MFRTKRRIILFIAAFVVVVGVLLFLALSEGAPTATTANGRKVTIEKVTFGTHHRFFKGKWWVRVLRPIRGKRWAAQRGAYEVRFTNDVPTLMVWTRWEGISQSNNVAVEATILDQLGTESELIAYRWHDGPVTYSNAPGTEASRVAWLLSNFPRRSKTLRLRIYDRDKRYMPTQAVEMAFSNPARKRSAEWRGSELPLTIKTNDTEFVLTRVQQTSNALWRLSFLVRTNGEIDPSWLVGGITASSASGNVLSTRSNLAAAATTNLTFHLRGTPWPEEPVWRFAADFFRTVDFQPNELWRLTNIAIPTRSLPFQFTTNLVSYRNHPIEFKLESTPSYVPWRRGDIRRNANVYVRFDADDAHLFLLAVRDDHGREVRTEVFPGAPRQVYLFGLEVPQGAQSLNLTFAVRKAARVRFEVSSDPIERVVP